MICVQEHRSLIADDRMLADRCMSDLRYRLQMICTRKRGAKEGQQKGSCERAGLNKAALRV